MADLEFADSVYVAQDPEQVYALVSDVTRMGQWSPVCRACWWDDDERSREESDCDERSREEHDDGGGPRVGAWFTGRNETPERTWETRSQVIAADPGREFAWEVNNGWVRWGFTLQPESVGTRLTQSWHFLPKGIAGFHERFGDDAEAQIAQRSASAHTGIPETLAAIKKTAEGA